MATIINEIEWWRAKANEYEWLYRKQKEIAEGYKILVLELSEKESQENNENDYSSGSPNQSYASTISIMHKL
jgi:hypothetical protein